MIGGGGGGGGGEGGGIGGGGGVGSNGGNAGHKERAGSFSSGGASGSGTVDPSHQASHHYRSASGSNPSFSQGYDVTGSSGIWNPAPPPPQPPQPSVTTSSPSSFQLPQSRPSNITSSSSLLHPQPTPFGPPPPPTARRDRSSSTASGMQPDRPTDVDYGSNARSSLLPSPSMMTSNHPYSTYNQPGVDPHSSSSSSGRTYLPSMNTLPSGPEPYGAGAESMSDFFSAVGAGGLSGPATTSNPLTMQMDQSSRYSPYHPSQGMQQRSKASTGVSGNPLRSILQDQPSSSSSRQGDIPMPFSSGQSGNGQFMAMEAEPSAATSSGGHQSMNLGSMGGGGMAISRSDPSTTSSGERKRTHEEGEEGSATEHGTEMEMEPEEHGSKRGRGRPKGSKTKMRRNMPSSGEGSTSTMDVLPHVDTLLDPPHRSSIPAAQLPPRELHDMPIEVALQNLLRQHASALYPPTPMSLGRGSQPQTRAQQISTLADFSEAVLQAESDFYTAIAEILSRTPNFVIEFSMADPTGSTNQARQALIDVLENARKASSTFMENSSQSRNQSFRSSMQQDPATGGPSMSTYTGQSPMRGSQSQPAAPYQLQTVLNTGPETAQQAYRPSFGESMHPAQQQQEFISNPNLGFGSSSQESIMASGSGPSQSGMRTEGPLFPTMSYQPMPYQTPTSAGLPPSTISISTGPGGGYDIQSVNAPWSSGSGGSGLPGLGGSSQSRQNLSGMSLPPPGALASQAFNTSPPYGSNAPFTSLMSPSDRGFSSSRPMGAGGLQRLPGDLPPAYHSQRLSQPGGSTSMSAFGIQAGRGDEPRTQREDWSMSEPDRSGGPSSFPRSGSMIMPMQTSERGGSGPEESPRSDSSRKKRVVHGPWKEEEGNRLKELAAASKGRNPKLGPDEVDWDWVCQQFGKSRSRHQILIKAVYLGIKPTTTHSSRLIRQKQFQGREEEVPGITPEKLERIRAEKAGADAGHQSGGELQASPPYPQSSEESGDYRRLSQAGSSRSAPQGQGFLTSPHRQSFSGIMSGFSHDSELPGLGNGSGSFYQQFPQPPPLQQQGFSQSQSQQGDVFRGLPSNIRGSSDEHR